MNTTSFTIDTQTVALIDELKANKVPIFESNGKYRSVIPVYRELDLVDLICEVAKKTKASADVEVHYQDGSGLDQCTYNLRFINGMDEEEFDLHMEKLEEKIDEENERDYIQSTIEQHEAIGIPCDSMGNPIIKID